MPDSSQGDWRGVSRTYKQSTLTPCAGYPADPYCLVSGRDAPQEDGTMTTTILTGREAIKAAEERGLELKKYADPVEGAREGLTVEEARQIAHEDPSLVYVVVEVM